MCNRAADRHVSPAVFQILSVANFANGYGSHTFLGGRNVAEIDFGRRANGHLREEKSLAVGRYREIIVEASEELVNMHVCVVNRNVIPRLAIELAGKFHRVDGRFTLIFSNKIDT